MTNTNTSHGSIVLLVRHSSICRPAPASTATVHLITVAPLNEHIMSHWHFVICCVGYLSLSASNTKLRWWLSVASMVPVRPTIMASIVRLFLLRAVWCWGQQTTLSPAQKENAAVHSFHAALFGKICWNTCILTTLLWSPYVIGQTIIMVFMVALCNRADHNIFIL